MRTRQIGILLGMLAAAASTGASTATAQSSPRARTLDAATRVDAVFADVDSATTPGCAVSVMRDGALVYERGYGMANLEYGIPITPQSIFHVASVSKQFTAFAVVLLAARGGLDLDDDVREYVPEVPDFGETLTIRHLLHHTSGIRDQWSLLGMAGWRFEADVITQGDVLDITSRQRALNFPPGEEYLYSNTGYTLLGLIVERVSGRTLREFAQDEIFGPLGMTRTHFHDDHNMIVPGRAYAYTRDRDGVYGLRTSIPDFDVVGATSLFTTVHDMAAWDRNFYTARVGGRAAVDTMLIRGVLNDGDTIGYALALSHGSYRGLPTIGHSGSDAGYRAQFLRFPEQRFSTAVLCNAPWSNPGDRARRVADAYLEDAFPDPDEADEPDEPDEPAPPPGVEFVDVPEEELEALEGRYRLATDDEGEGDVIQVRERGGGLALSGVGVGVIRPIGGGRFLSVERGWVFTFEPARDGRPGRMTTPEDLGSRVYERLEPWEPGPAELRGFTGRYYSDELATEYVIELDDEGELIRTHRKLGDSGLQPTYEDTFRMGGSTVVFSRNDAGVVDGFRISSGRVRNVEFERVERR